MKFKLLSLFRLINIFISKGDKKGHKFIGYSVIAFFTVNSCFLDYISVNKIQLNIQRLRIMENEIHSPSVRTVRQFLTIEHAVILDSTECKGFQREHPGVITHVSLTGPWEQGLLSHSSF